MKYRGVHSLPPSIVLWLEQQLELRGIDSVVYTRYILSLLNDETYDFNDLITHRKGNKKLSSWKSCNLEDLKRTAVIQCLTEAAERAFEIENLFDELCAKLKEADSKGDKCLKEKTNSEDIFNLDLPLSSLDLANKYYSAFPALTKSNSCENPFPLSSVWNRNICRALGGGRRRGDSESSLKDNKISKRKDNKENVLGGVVNGSGARRMRSRSTVKQSSSGHHHRNRSSTAKSLDRKEDESNTAMKRSYGATKTMSGDLTGDESLSLGMETFRGKKSFSLMQNSLGQLIGYSVSCGPSTEELVPHQRDDKISRTPGRKCNGGGYKNSNTDPKLMDFLTTDCIDSAELPVNFQQLLTSPSDVSNESSLYKQCQPNPPCSGALSSNFIQCGTNITSSIWSDTCEKMEEDESAGSSGNWESVCCSSSGNAATGGNSKWSDARGSILSSAWKLPFVYDKDVEGTSLEVFASSGSFYSFFDTKPIPSLFLAQKDKTLTEIGENKVVGRKDDTLLSAGEQEEDLLTSMKTHFRPIRNSDNGNGVGTTAEDGTLASGIEGGYKNGSTFTDKSASPVKLDYKRSESGALYLIPTGEKYLEYKNSSPPFQSGNSQQAQDQISSSQITSTFVPKFKVRQNEKFCQTDMPSSSLEENEFFFPGGNRLTEEIDGCCEDIEGVEIEENDDWFEDRAVGSEIRQTIQVSGWVTAWPVAMSSNAGIWSSASNGKNANAWISGKNNEMNNVGDDSSCLEDCKMDDRNEHYLRLRDELSEEGEELLSDLSSIHLFLDPDRMDEPNPFLQAHYSNNNNQLRHYPLQPGNLTNERFF